MNPYFWLLMGLVLGFVRSRLPRGKRLMDFVVFLVVLLLAGLIYGWSPIFSVVLILGLCLLAGYRLARRERIEDACTEEFQRD